MSADDARRLITQVTDGTAWPIGGDAEVAWIQDGTSTTTLITDAIPPLFDAYATVELPESGGNAHGLRNDEQECHDRALLAVLSRHTAPQRWWLGYLDTGADDVVFPDAPPVTLYANWPYVLVGAGPQQAAAWRSEGLGSFWKGSTVYRALARDRACAMT